MEEFPPDRLRSTTPGGVQPRLYCPGPTCQHHQLEKVPGWTSLKSMRVHLNLGACGQLESPILRQWLENNALGQSCVCCKVLHRRFMPACPRCRPSLLQALPSSLPPQPRSSPIPHSYPSWETVFLHSGSTRKHIPQGARGVWSQTQPMLSFQFA
eukprot:1234181-Amphidinium_carterae.1